MVAPSPRWSEKTRPLRLNLKSCVVPSWSRGIDSWSRLLRDGQESRALSVVVGKVALSLPWPGKSRRFRLGRKELILGRAVSAMVGKVAPSLPWSEKSRCLCFSLESRVVSVLVAWN